MARKRVRRKTRGGYKMTSARRAALRKAQLASARKRRGRGKVRSHVSRNRRRYAVGGAVAVTAVAGLTARHKLSGSKLGGFTTQNVSLIDQIHGTKNPVPLVRGIKVNRSSNHIDVSIRLPKGMRGVAAYNHRPVNIPSARKMVTGVKQSDLLKPIRDRRQIKQAAERKAAWQRDLAAIRLKEQAEAKREYARKQRRAKALKKRREEASSLAKAQAHILEMV